jgi:cytochrome c peroxidase
MPLLKNYIILFTLAAGIVPAACNKKTDTPKDSPYILSAPANMPPIVPFTDNPQTKEGVELGRLLFYDKRLSGNNSISCASCHRQDIAFTDALALSDKGVSGNKLHRTAPALINLAWANNGLFWDGGSTNLESQAFGPLSNADEMNQDLIKLVEELQAEPDYVKRFQLAFNDDVIKTGYIARALAQFQRTMISAGSRYDKYKRNEAGGQLTSQELQGLSIVQQKCQGCHAGELFTDNGYHNNGLDTNFPKDTLEGLYQGRARITYNEADLGRFRTPTLRNVMLTAPYMHDGRFASMDIVLDHYSKHVQASATLDPLVMQPGGTPGIPLTSTDKQAIIAFLHTLTDEDFINSKKFSDPRK